MGNNKIILENFNEYNRDRKIGNSLYRICNTDGINCKGKWYIHEAYNDGSEWVRSNSYYSDSLKETIDRINSFTAEKEVVALRFGK